MKYDSDYINLFDKFDELCKDFEKIKEMTDKYNTKPRTLDQTQYLVKGTYTVMFHQAKSFQECVKASGCVHITEPIIDTPTKTVSFYIGSLKNGQYNDFQRRWNMYISPIELKEKRLVWYKRILKSLKRLLKKDSSCY